MITNSSSVASGATPAPDPRRHRAAAVAAAAVRADSFSPAQVGSLREALAQAPAQRPDVVERAQNIAIDPNYPPLKIIERVAKLIAESQDASEITE